MNTEETRPLKDPRVEALKRSILHVTDEKLTWPEIKKRVAQGDIVYIIALNIAKRKIEDMENRKTNKRATKYMSIYDATHLISYALMAIYLSLSFFQKPAWCLRAPISQPDDNAYYNDCSGTIREGRVIPLSNLPYLQNWQLVVIELICVTLLTARRYIKQIVKKQTSFTLFKAIFCVACLVYLSEILQYIVGISFPFNKFLRPVFFAIYTKTVRANLKLYCRIFWRSKEIFIVIAAIFIFFVCVARVIFHQTPQNAPGPANFSSFFDTMYHLFVSLTTSNYPDVMMPIYTQYRTSSLYFIVFMTIINLVLLNIIVAFFYYNYKAELMQEVHTFQKDNFKLIEDIFNSEIETEHFHIGTTAALLANPDVSKIYDEVGRLHREEVQKILERSSWKRALIETLELQKVKAILAMASLLTFILLVIQSNLVSPNPQSTYSPDEVAYNQKFTKYWLFLELGLNIFLFLDPLLKLVAIGWKYFVESRFLVFELTLSITIIGLIMTRLFIQETLTLTVVRIILMFRMWRFFRWVNSFEKYKLIFRTLSRLVPLFLDLLGILTIAFYFYASLGEELFGGQLKTNLTINFQQFGNPAYYVYVNFNDFANGLFTCFHLLIVNNWLYTVDVHCRTMGNFAYRIFFVSFYIVCVVICLNIMIAFILDIYITQIANKNRQVFNYSPSRGATLQNVDEVRYESLYSPELHKKNDDLLEPSESEISLFSSGVRKKPVKETELSPTRRNLGEKLPDPKKTG